MSLTILPSSPSWKLDSGSPLPAMSLVEMLSSSNSEDCGMVAALNATSKTQLQFTGTSLKLHGYITNDRSHGDFSAASAQVDGVSALIYPPVGSFCTQLASWDNLDPSVTHTLNFGPFNASFGQYLLKYAEVNGSQLSPGASDASSTSPTISVSESGSTTSTTISATTTSFKSSTGPQPQTSRTHGRNVIVGSVVGGCAFIAGCVAIALLMRHRRRIRADSAHPRALPPMSTSSVAPPDRGINPLKAKLTDPRPRMDLEGRVRRGERDAENERLRNALAALQSEMQELRLGNEGTETLPDYESRDE